MRCEVASGRQASLVDVNEVTSRLRHLILKSLSVLETTMRLDPDIDGFSLARH